MQGDICTVCSERCPGSWLQTRVRVDFTITEKAPSRAFSCLKAPTSGFTSKTLGRHYAKLNRCLKTVSRGEIVGLLRDCAIFANVR